MKTLLIEPEKNIEIEVNEDTQYVLDLSDKEIDCEINLIFSRQGVVAELIGLYNLAGNEKLALTTITTHKVPNTSCVTNIRGVLDGSSESNYSGKIIIEKLAQQTNSYLNDDILVTGNKTKNRSDPILMIEADDVKASHGATTGRIGQDEMYYLMSRGISKNDARNLIISGFFEALLSKIEDQRIKDRVSTYLLG